MKVLDKKRVEDEKLERYVNSEKNILTKLNHPFLIGLNYAF
jgi:hypothetical protein